MTPAPAIARRLVAGRVVLPSLLLLLGASVAPAATPVIEFSAAGFALAENAGPLNVRVVRGGDLSGTSTVQFASSNGTAVAGVDFTGVAGTLTFAPGESNQTVSITLLDNAASQPSRFFSLSLANFSNAGPGLQSNATVTLLDDETSNVLDPWFDPGLGANKDIFTLGLLADGRILVGGQFTKYNNITGLANFTVLRPDGALDPAFAGTASVPDNTVYAAVASADGGILIGGDFTSVGGVARSYLARVKPGGGVDTNFVPAAINNGLRAILVQPDGKILIGGRFTQVGGQPRNRVARLNADGSLDPAFAPVSGADNSVRGMALQPDGRVLIGGQFLAFDGTSRVRLARLLTNGTLDTTFDPGTGADKQVRSLAVQTDGKILLGGEFENYNGALRSCVARLFANGALDPGFDAGPSTNDQIRAVAPAPGGKVWIGGNFSFAGGTPRSYLALLGTNGLADPFAADADFEVDTILTQPDGQTLVAGDFSSVANLAAPRLARLNTGAPVPRFQLATGNLLVSENAGQAAVTVTRRGDSTVAAQVGFTTRNGTAIVGADYVATVGTMIFAPTETTKILTLPIINDSLPDPNETFFLALTNPAPPAVLVGITNATITIQDDDTGIEFTADTFTASEPAGSAVIVVRRGGTGSDTVSVDFIVRSGTAAAGADFVATNGTVIFQPGETQKTFFVTILADQLAEGLETALLTLTNASAGAVLGARTSATLSIDDVEGVFTWGGIFPGGEFFGYTTVTIERLGVRNLPATVDYFFINGSAVNGLDFLGTNGTLHFAPGEPYKFIDVPIVNDGFVEGTETFSIQLANATGGAVINSNSNFVVTVLDNDAGLEFVDTNLVVSENSRSVTLGVRRHDDGPESFSVEYFTSDGTALAGVNYQARSATLHCPTNSTTNTVTIPLLDECGLTNDRTFTVRLRNPSNGGVLGTNTVATVTIRGNDRPGRRDVSFNLSPLTTYLAYTTYIEGLAALPNGQVLRGTAGFAPFGSPRLPRAVRLNGDGSLDPTWTGVDPGFACCPPNIILVLRDGRVLQSGRLFPVSGPVWWTGVLRLSASGEWDGFWLAGDELDSGGRGARDVTGLVEQPDGRILVGRDAYRVGNPGLIPHPGIFRLLTDGSSDPSFIPGNGAQLDEWGSGVLALGLQTDGRILLGGFFTSFSGVACRGLVCLQTNGAVDLSFSTDGNPLSVREIKFQSDGKILIAGYFGDVSGIPRPGLARLLTNGLLDTTFQPGAIPGGGVSKILVQPNGRIVIGGSFYNVQGFARQGLARLNADGSLDQTFDPAPEPYSAVALALQPDGRILVSDYYTGLWRVDGDPMPRVREVSRTNGVARLHLDSRPGKSYALEASTNLVQWLRLQTNTAADCTMEFLDAASPPGKRFYRAVQLSP